jgi:argininosuccinate lyase
MSRSAIDHVEGVGGRLAVPKSEAYRQALSVVEARALPYVARYMLASDVAYVLSAGELGLTPPDVARQLLGCLLDLLGDVGRLTETPSAVDIVVQREAWVAERVGTAASDWLHVGRNRGESVRGYLPRLVFRDALFRDRVALLDLLDALLTRAAETLDAPAPVYHHLQHAGVTTLGEWLLSYAGNLAPHIGRFDDALKRLDVAPPVMNGRPVLVEHAERVRQRLGFSALQRLRQQIHVTEDHFAEPLFALVLLNVAEARLAEDLRLYSTSEFAFFEVDDSHASGSSLLPQKKNPFGLQAVIGGAAMGAGRLAGQLAANVSLSEELDAAFHAATAYQYAVDAVAWTRFMAEVVERGRFDLAELKRKAGTNFAGASEALDILVVEAGVPLRHAHHLLGALVRKHRAGESGDHLAELRAEAPTIDHARLERVLTGKEFPAIALNVEASRAALNALRTSVAAARSATPPNPVEAAIERVSAEARRAIGRA